ncbi:Protein CBG25647 [Caenorhabditis briggsae]|uniref:Protein CBG25647 n=1 Tax=Caenorhabditis briggsae TaxID=6238 RepID=B6IFD1_CAEBR|nr:Protein CBG25647 [Caenorhabditis briggsae]CAR98611.1 Protein CBG25647 [Caenorhabditis briggsae]
MRCLFRGKENVGRVGKKTKRRLKRRSLPKKRGGISESYSIPQRLFGTTNLGNLFYVVSKWVNLFDETWRSDAQIPFSENASSKKTTSREHRQLEEHHRFRASQRETMSRLSVTITVILTHFHSIFYISHGSSERLI